MFFRRKSKEAEPDSDGFYPTGITAVSLTPNERQTVKINGDPIILTRWLDKIHAFSALCPHASGDLRKGDLYKGRIDCPDHGWRFDITSGRVLFPPDEACRLKHFAVKEVDGQIWIK